MCVGANPPFFHVCQIPHFLCVIYVCVVVFEEKEERASENVCKCATLERVEEKRQANQCWDEKGPMRTIGEVRKQNNKNETKAPPSPQPATATSSSKTVVASIAVIAPAAAAATATEL